MNENPQLAEKEFWFEQFGKAVKDKDITAMASVALLLRQGFNIQRPYVAFKRMEKSGGKKGKQGNVSATAMKKAEEIMGDKE
jgi:hypothetical protein